ncbi:MAG: FYDLN acid domain-containing protein [Holosporales bacterium]|jgi:hypothetical protein|nr:FYDLN acid domain-containing protein [Holosporales bacterium]
MVAQAWGKKRVCAGCSVRYYDLKKASPVCPKCGTAAELQLLSKGKKRADLQDLDANLFSNIDEVEDVTADDLVETLDGSFDDDIELPIDEE